VPLVRKLVVHKKIDGEFGYKLCEPFALDDEVKRKGVVSVFDDEVTCKWCLVKIKRKAVGAFKV